MMYLVDDGRMPDVSDSRCYQTDDDQWYKEAQKLAEHIVVTNMRTHTSGNTRPIKSPNTMATTIILLAGAAVYPKGASFCVVCLGVSGRKVPPFGALERHFRGVRSILSIFQL